MMTRDEDGTLRAKLIDLGIAKIAQSKEELTAADEFIGKLRYSSPEQLTKSASSPQIDGRSDLFSLGIVLYEILTGVCPYGGESLHEIIGNRLESPPLSFDVSDPQKRLPPALKQVVLKALERSPADRYATAADFSSALEAFADAGGDGEREQVDHHLLEGCHCHKRPAEQFVSIVAVEPNQRRPVGRLERPHRYAGDLRDGADLGGSLRETGT